MEDYSKKLSIIIPVHERNYVFRVVEYYQNFKNKFNINVYIVDSSTKKKEHNFGNLNYLYYGPHKNVEKYIDILEKIDTKYVMLVGDDDIAAIDGVMQCLNFLIANTEYSACHGKVVKFDEKTGDILDVTYQDKHFLNFTEENFFSKDPISRLINYFDFNNFFMLNHSLVDRITYLDSFEKYNNELLKNFRKYRFSDQLNAIYLLLEGNVKVLKNLFLLRSNDRMLDKNQVPEYLEPQHDFTSYPEIMLNEETDFIGNMIASKSKLPKNIGSFLHGFLIGKYIEARFRAKNIPTIKKNKLAEYYFKKSSDYNCINNIIKKI